MLFAAGCNDETSAPATNDHDAEHADADEHGEHDHPSHGPHEGDLIELGGEDYHAEIVHTDDDEIVIYILGSDAKTAMPIEATEVVINAVHDGNPEQFKLAASADAGDPEGKSSRFTSSDAELVEHVHDEDAEAKLVLMIGGKQHTGKIAHDHDHGHDHE
jgi:hypothetical protein